MFHHVKQQRLFRKGGLATKMSSMEKCDIIVFGPHPDDEALGCAGMIYNQLKKGRKVKVVVLTNGDADRDSWELLHNSKPGYKDMIEHGRTRQKETISAMNLLGLREEDILFLGYPDQGLKEICYSQKYTEISPFKSDFTDLTNVAYENSYNKGAPYCKACFIGDVKNIIKLYQPKRIFIPHPKDGSGDHHASGEMIRDVVKQMNKSISIFGYYIYMASKVSNLKTTHRTYYKVTGKLKEFVLNEETKRIKERCLDSYKTQEYFLNPVRKYYNTKESFWKLE